MRALRLAALARLGLAACLAWPLPLSAEPYRLHAQDRLLIRVLIWDFRQNSLVGWQDLSGEYTLGPEGLLQLPLAGEIAAEGLTQAELGTAISDLLRRRAGLDEAPMLSIELVSSIPVYVLGHVETRGAVPFRPGLSAQQALALAGGVYRPAASDPVRAASVAAELRAAEDGLARLRAERAGIEAELAQLRREAESEAGLPGDGQLPDPVADSTAAALPGAAPAEVRVRLQQADRTARRIRIESYAQLREVLREKAERLNRQLELRDLQIAETRKQLDDVASLNERGLAVNARVTSLSTALSDMEAKRLELETALLLLEEQRNQAERDSSTLVADAAASRLQRMAELEGLIAEAELKRDSVRTQAALLAPGTADGAAGGEIGFMLTRDGRTTPVAADATLLPGDTLDVVWQQTAPASPENMP